MTLRRRQCTRCVTVFFLSLLSGAAAVKALDHERSLNQQRALYSIPPFSISFRSPNQLPAASAEEMDLTEQGKLIASTLGVPLKLIVQEFLMEGFSIQVARASSDPDLPDIVRELVGLDFDVRVLHRETEVEEPPSADTNGAPVRGRHAQEKVQHYLEFYAEFVGFCAFQEPYTAEDKEKKPTNEAMWDLLDHWTTAIFNEDIELFENRLRASTLTALKQHDHLIVKTDIEANHPDPFAMQNAAVASQGRSASEKAMIAVLVIGLTAIVAALTLVLRPRYHVFREKFGSTDGAFPVSSTMAALPAPQHQQVLPGRHEDAMDVLEASDRYLSQHRPDLFNAMHQLPEGASQTVASCSTISSSSSKPMQFLYGGLFFKSGQDPSVSIGTTEQSLASQDEVALVKADSNNTSALSPVAGWWRSLASQLGSVGSFPPSSGDGLVCDEDPRAYPFAFSDFPRHDGTPCLIYSESDCDTNGMGKEETVEFGMETSGSHNSLTDDQFKRELSIQNRSFEIEGEIEVVDVSQTQFTEKLERLVQMRHRRFQKDQLIHKGRQARQRQQMLEEQQHAIQQRRREQEEQRHRDLKLRRHEMELDLEEIEGSLTPRALSRKQSLRNLNAGPAPDKYHRSQMAHVGTNVMISPLQENQNNYENHRGVVMAEPPVQRRSHRVISSDPDQLQVNNSNSGKPFCIVDDDEDDFVFTNNQADDDNLSQADKLLPVTTSDKTRPTVPVLSPDSSVEAEEGKNVNPPAPRVPLGRRGANVVTDGDKDPFVRKRSDESMERRRRFQNQNRRHRRSHRRSSSHGANRNNNLIGQEENLPRVRSDSNGSDVMTFGIAAAYSSNFV